MKRELDTSKAGRTGGRRSIGRAAIGRAAIGRAAIGLALCAAAAGCGSGAAANPDGLVVGADLTPTGTPLDSAMATDGAMTPLDASLPQGTDGGQCAGAVTTAGVQCAYSHNAFNAAASVNANSTVAWSCSPTERNVTGNGLPDHDVGTFPNANCPNTITAQAVSAALTLSPVLAAMATNFGPAGVGYALNGVKLDPGTAGTCTVANGQTSCSLIGNTGTWNIEALGQSSFNFGVDSSNAHVQPSGAYHYHGMPNGFIANLGKGQEMTLVGFALDGFPVYARYGFTDPNDAKSAIKVVTGSYQLKQAPDANRPSTNTYPMGAFTQDYQYSAGSGDLDECNGRTGVTPEFPCGIYHYYITDSWPFIGRCLKGTATGNGAPPDGGMGMAADGGMPGPKACAMGSDCVGACPPGSKGCGCETTPMGMRCVPTCNVTADCPMGAMGPLACHNGVCTP